MCIDGVMVLGNLNSSDENSKSLGENFFQVIEAGGIITFIMGLFNIIASYIFRDRQAAVTARMVRAHGATAAAKVANDVRYQGSNTIATPQIARSNPGSVRTVVSSTNDQLPFYNAPRRANSAISESRYSQSTAAPQDFHIRDPKLDPDMEVPAMVHPAHRGAEFV